VWQSRMTQARGHGEPRGPGPDDHNVFVAHE
jgi:hypothetical protein